LCLIRVRNQKNNLSSLKARIKYLLSLFILLLIGYSQLFAPLYRGSAPDVATKKIAAAQKVALNASTTDVQTTLIADEEVEDDERDSIKKYSEECTAALLFYPPAYFTPRIKSTLYFQKSFLNSISSGSRYLMISVFRL
jgi:hypothetical protein